MLRRQKKMAKKFFSIHSPISSKISQDFQIFSVKKPWMAQGSGRRQEGPKLGPSIQESLTNGRFMRGAFNQTFKGMLRPTFSYL